MGEDPGAGEGEDLGADQPIVDHHIGGSDKTQRAQRQQVGRAGACADESDGSGGGDGHGGSGSGLFDFIWNIGNIPGPWPYAADKKDVCSR